MKTTALCMFMAAFALAACHHHDDTPEVHGPASAVRAGVHETKENVKDVGHDTKCGAKNAKDDARHEGRDPNCD